MDLIRTVCHKGKKMDNGFEKYHKWAFLKHQTYLGFNGPSKQINGELNTPLGWVPLLAGTGAGTSQGAAAKLGLSPLHRVVWTFSFLPPAVPSRPYWLSGGPCWSCLHQCLKCLSTLRGQLFFSLAWILQCCQSWKLVGRWLEIEERFPTVLAVVSYPRGAAPATCHLQPALGWFGQLGGQWAVG